MPDVKPSHTSGAYEDDPKLSKRSTTWLRSISRANLAGLLLTYIGLVHFVGLYVFTKGFLLSRVSIPLTTSPYSEASPLPFPPTYSKAVILVIDALRTDFISPHSPEPRSPHHHGILSLPAELMLGDPSRSMIFNGYSDPPTTTMQRIKGITTGSLPTFVDAGANFASTAIEEDSIISQFVTANKTVAFMGDDTWVNLFPTAFTRSHPYDSFNVEDLHSVDNGVIEHLFPYLQPENSSTWDVLIGHFLGVDHVGHRVGPERETMRVKLEQMDRVLREVTELLDDDTLLVVLGDHGMDSKGNHGGDSSDETSAALWLYSKGPPLFSGANVELASRWPTYTHPGSSTSIRHVNQIDLVPTLSLLLGFPIPFNNLGTIIPECFASDAARLELATRVNSEQIKRYISEYGDQAVEQRVAGAWSQAESTARQVSEITPEVKVEPTGRQKVADWLRTGKSPPTVATSTQDHDSLLASIDANRDFALGALEQLRALWAQFSVPLILVGLSIMGLSIPALLSLCIGIRNNGPTWDIFVRLALETAFTSGAGIGAIIGTLAGIYTQEPIVALKTFAVTAIAVSEVVLAAPIFVSRSLLSLGPWRIQRAIGPLMLAFHAISFASNSFIMWEDRMVLFLLVTIIAVHLIKAPTAPTASMRLRILVLGVAFAAIIRLVSTITICREEQQPYCRVTFYSGSTPTAPTWTLLSIIPLALQLPRGIARILDLSRSLNGPAHLFLGKVWRGVLVVNAIYWLLEYLESSDRLQPERVPLVNLLKLWIARGSAGVTLGAMPYIWLSSGLCIDVQRDPDQTGESKAVTVLGFANAFGSTYLIFLLIPFAFIHLVTQPMGQVTLSALLIALLAYLELIDTQRDATIMTQAFATSSNPGAFEPGSSNTIVRPSFTDIIPLALMGFVGYFATGHQAVLTSIQWKAAFVGFESVTYPYSPLLVIINTWGPFALSALAVPLLALWNISPRPQGSAPLLAHSLQLSIAFIIYHTTVTFASALFAAWLRRHLMVWKVFAPRFMLAGCTLMVVDLTLLFAMTIGVRVTTWKVWRTFKSASI